MTSLPSQFSVQAEREKLLRRRQILAALDIDVWSLRLVSAATAQAGEGTAAPAAGVAPRRQVPAGSGPAAARALLEESAKSPRAAVTATPSAATQAVGASAAEAVANRADGLMATAGLDLLCLSAPHGLLLVTQTGLSPQAKRLLQDILSSVSRVVAARLAAVTQADEPGKPARTRLQSLRFNWPPATSGGEQLDDVELGDTARALRGFLSRQLQGKAEPVVLYVARDGAEGPDATTDLAELVGQLELPIAAERRVQLAAPERLMSDSSLKRTLWQTLSVL